MNLSWTWLKGGKKVTKFTDSWRRIKIQTYFKCPIKGVFNRLKNASVIFEESTW